MTRLKYEEPKKLELLSPAGSFASLKAAVHAGCDAVYFGVADLNARASADNATLDNVHEWVEYAHLYGVRVFVTVNTLVKPKELDYACTLLSKLDEIGTDGIIVQDLGVVELAKTYAPNVELHASTQMTVVDLEGALYLKELGFKRVVLARELSKDEIKFIKDNSGLEIEVFVHGALCMCYSGQCLMSSMIGGRSGNRGMCAQPCRLPYEIVDKNSKELKKGYLLSLKDLSLIDQISALAEIGVDSLKIEGRLKRPEYVATVTGIYRKNIDGIRNSKQDHEALLNAFNRGGFTDGYFTGKLGASMMCYDNPSNVASNTYTDEANQIVAGKLVKRIPITIYASLKIGEPFSLTAFDNDGNSSTYSSTVLAEKAINKPIDEASLITRLSKLGNTPFKAISIEIDCDGISIISASEINNARRTVCEELSLQRQSSEKRKPSPLGKVSAKLTEEALSTFNFCDSLRSHAEVRQIQIKDLGTHAQLSTYLTAYTTTEEQYNICKQLGIARIYSNNDGVVQNIGGLYSIKEPNDYVIGHRLNVSNQVSAELFKAFKAVTLSPELTIKEIKQIASNTSAHIEVIAYGRLPLMTMKNCPLKSAGFCQNHNQLYSLKDRKGLEFPVQCTQNCKAILLNSKPIYTADRFSELLNCGIEAFALMFTTESAAHTKKIIEDYKQALLGKSVTKPSNNEFTRGYFFK